MSALEPCESCGTPIQNITQHPVIAGVMHIDNTEAGPCWYEAITYQPDPGPDGWTRFAAAVGPHTPDKCRAARAAAVNKAAET